MSQFTVLCVRDPNVGLQISMSIFRDFKTSSTRLGHSISLETVLEMNKFSWHLDIILLFKHVVA